MTDSFYNNVTNTNLKTSTEDLYKSITNIFTEKNKRKGAFLIFNNSLNFIKIIMVITFICLAVYNTIKYEDIGIISSKPLLFFAESLLFGLTIFIPLLISWTIRKTYLPFTTILKDASILGVVFVILNYIIELSGVWDYMYSAHSKETFESENDQCSDINNTTTTSTTSPSITTPNTSSPSTTTPISDQCKPEYKNVIYEIIDKLKKGNHTLKTTIIIIGLLVGLSILLMTLSTLYISDFSPEYIFDGVPPLLIFILEMLLYGIISAAPIYLIEYNRNNFTTKTTQDFIIQSLKLSCLFIVFQISGLWGSMFKDTFGLELEENQNICSKLDISDRINMNKSDVIYSCSIADSIRKINPKA